MSCDYGNLCSAILEKFFGEIVKEVGDCLFGATSRTLTTIVNATNLSRNEVKRALRILIRFELVSFKGLDTKPDLAEYSLKRDEILYIFRYARYAYLMQTKYGNVGSSIVEAILHEGSESGTNIMLKCISNPDNKEKLDKYKDVFETMIRDNYLIKLPLVIPLAEGSNSKAVPTFDIKPYDLFNPPDIDLQLISQIQAGTAAKHQATDKDILWVVNFKRFHQDMRDNIMIDAMERRLGASAAECMKYVLKEMYGRTDPWQKLSSIPFTVMEIKHLVEKNSNNLDLIKYLDQYMTVIADDSLRFIRKIGNMGGGQYVIELNHAFEELAVASVESIITERFGSKAARIFRIVRSKKYIDQEDLQKEAMIPAKEAKALTYSLFQAQFLQIKTIRKAGGGGTGPAKAFNLFHVRERQIIKMLLDNCYKAMYNIIQREKFEKSENERLLEKSQKLDGIVATMRARGDSEEYIAEILDTLTPPEKEIVEKVKTRLKTLSLGELNVQETVFLFQMYMHHSVPTSIQPNTAKE